MTQMVHAPAAPSWPLRLTATTALAVALAIRALPDTWRMRARVRLAHIARPLPPASHHRVTRVYGAVVACQPGWWRGQIDCKDRSIATVLAVALTGRRCHLVLGARTLPASFHAWVATTDGTPVGNDEAGGADHPWTPVYRTP
ncbi:lasso peptide biosynthesis B2 protein [Streptomyces tsukubensis]|uniref:lasso peptide biosynthesis B2 protein n=1 Tax=Streptomyces tsukubensis TaxID=83656 RepID=UPI00344EE0A1